MTWQSSYYHYDGQGSTRLLTDKNGNVTDSYAYTAFGEPVPTGAANPTPNPFQYVGREGYYLDADTGDYYVPARTYRPVLARWLSVDPIGFGGGDVNLYRYAKNSPTNATDPSGLVVWDPAQDSWKKSAKCIVMVGVASAGLTACNLAIVVPTPVPGGCYAPCCLAVASLSYIMSNCLQHEPNPKELKFMELLDDAKVACLTLGAFRFPWSKLLEGPK